MPELIDAALMASLVTFDESAMPSLCTVQYKTKTENDRGGTEQAATWLSRNNVPLACRIVAGGARDRITGERLTSVGDVTVQLALTGVQAESVVVQSDDEIDVVTTLHLASGDETVNERYKVVGKPAVGSYATNVSTPCVKVG